MNRYACIYKAEDMIYSIYAEVNPKYSQTHLIVVVNENCAPGYSNRMS